MQRNLILITIDCLRADHVSCLGYQKKVTPNIDKFAENAVLFPDAISNGPHTTTSFPSIMTSTYPLMYPEFKDRGLFLSRKRTSIAEVLSKRGYKTAAFHSNPYLTTHFGYNRGFKVFEEHLSGKKTNSFLSRFKSKNKLSRADGCGIRELLARALALRRELRKYLAEELPYVKAAVINRKVMEWISDTTNGFFLWIHYMDAHQPYLPPQTLLKHISALHLAKRTLLKYRDTYDGKLEPNDLRILIELYDKEISYIDCELSTLFNGLKDLGIWLDNTFLVITSDHGEEFMEHGGLFHGGKLYDELIRVPLLIAGPEIDSTMVHTQVSLIDLAPTLVDLLGLEKVSAFLGKSLVPLLTSYSSKEEGAISEMEYKSPRTNERKRGYSYRTKSWKYIFTLGTAKIKTELYNLSNDPREQRNMVDEKPAKAKALGKIIKQHMLMEEFTRSASATSVEKQRIKARIVKMRRNGSDSGFFKMHKK